MSNQEEVSAKEALELLDVSEGKLTTMLKSGELPWRWNPRNKKQKLIKRSAIEKWLAEAPPPFKKEERPEPAPAQAASPAWARETGEEALAHAEKTRSGFGDSAP